MTQALVAENLTTGNSVAFKIKPEHLRKYGTAKLSLEGNLDGGTLTIMASRDAAFTNPFGLGPASILTAPSAVDIDLPVGDTQRDLPDVYIRAQLSGEGGGADVTLVLYY